IVYFCRWNDEEKYLWRGMPSRDVINFSSIPRRSKRFHGYRDALDHGIGVRIPASQPQLIKNQLLSAFLNRVRRLALNHGIGFGSIPPSQITNLLTATSSERRSFRLSFRVSRLCIALCIFAARLLDRPQRVVHALLIDLQVAACRAEVRMVKEPL